MSRIKTTIAIAAAAALGLTACGGGAEDDAQAAGTLSFATWQFLEPNRGDKILKAIEGYSTTNEDVSFEKVEVARADYEKTLSTQFGAGAGPDLFVIPDAYFPQLIDSGILEPLDDVVEDASGFRNINDNYKVDGTQYGVIWEVVPYAMFWNEDIMAAAGVTPPTDVAELVAAGDAIKAATGKTGFTVRHQMNEETPWWTDFSNWVFGYGGAWSEDSKLTINSGKNVEALTAFKSVYDASGFGKGQDASTYRSAFAAGELGLSIDNSSAVMTLLGDAVPADKVGAAVLPFPDGGSAFAGFSIGVNANSDNKEAAKDFIKWMLTEDAQQDFADTLFPSAIATSATANDELMAANPWVSAFNEQINNASSVNVEGFDTQTAEIRTIILTQVERALTQNVSPQDALDEAQKQAEALVK
ncbi:extracellular solute-binding protein [Arthrobacter sp. zg-ZUI100]|uniref:ABC transporter substrate-binding protein n=1 Tax=Arthrobacter jiangjiafuii TaxID=2817475 RepID=UPI001AEE6D8C|nr:extracellular solute-binding protein [Arthrobacter jiangjiafuii]MBP3037173.1 extracellular solute-binding protein [Arthrobacter jiangjiafuii]